MAKKIAVITGASSGMGRLFAQSADRFDQFDEIWAIARRQDRLEELAANAPFPVRPLAFDLTESSSFEQYQALLEKEKPLIGLLVNASGFGKFSAVMDTPLEENINMLDLNAKAVMVMCQLSIPYMSSGSQIINIASVAAYQPIPYINVYAATKAFVLFYSRALHRELRSRGIQVLAVCPFWTKTAFFDRAVNEDREKVVKKYIAMYDPRDIVSQAWRDAKKGKDMSKYGFVARAQGMLVRLLPHRVVMDTWQRQQKLN